MPQIDEDDSQTAEPDSSLNHGAAKARKNDSAVIKRLGELAKITAVLLVMGVAFWFAYTQLREQKVDLEKIREGIKNLPMIHILVAITLTALNYLILTGYDWIAIRHLKKKLSLSRIMAGAIVGYSWGNVLGWLLGGNLIRYRMYSKWGFSTLEIIALISILSITFWLGLFLLAGVAFVALPTKIPNIDSLSEKFETAKLLLISQSFFGWIFLGCVASYLIACLFIRQPIRFRTFSISLPPFRLSAMQLMVSAGDFLLATATLYALLPSEVVGPDKINFSTVLIAYLTAQIVAVLTHVPGGYGLLEAILLAFLGGTETSTPVACAIILFRVIYYFLPFTLSSLFFLSSEYSKSGTPEQSPESSL